MKMIQNCCTSDVAQRANTAQIAAKISTKNIPKAPRTTHKTITTLNADISHNTGCAQCLRVPAISKNAAAMGGPSKPPALETAAAVRVAGKAIYATPDPSAWRDNSTTPRAEERRAGT